FFSLLASISYATATFIARAPNGHHTPPLTSSLAPPRWFAQTTKINRRKTPLIVVAVVIFSASGCSLDLHLWRRSHLLRSYLGSLRFSRRLLASSREAPRP
uniref:Uncharacterized protein n=1 Tax=Aegilops tauschii subsp. strangulata TaxID=200361 RepID=A0A453KAG0_AEGTS